ncbi:MAG: methionyl-tRNA formyltransferase [Firmicutes bacterium]|nr:methionyl-tRNA formyltransferase [Bacillota bacterium]
MARLVLMGTPEYARRIFAGVWDPSDEILVVTKPDAPQGRRRVSTPSAVADWAQSLGLSVLKPTKMVEIRPALEAFSPDWILTAAFGRILPAWLLALPRCGAYNLHASLLPRWRGPNPIAWAIKSGDAITGVTLMQMDAGVDTGPIVEQKATAIDPEDTTGTLTGKLADLAVLVWREVRARHGVVRFDGRPQDDAKATYAPKFSRDAGRIAWGDAARAIDAHVRSMTPEPGAYTMLRDQRVKILQASPEPAPTAGQPPGFATLAGEDWRVTTGEGMLRVRRIQPEGRRPMTPGEFARGQRGDGGWQLT